MQWPVGAATRELAQQGLLTNLDDLAAAGNWAKNLPPIILKNVIIYGHFVSAPVDIHSANWMFYSTKVFKALNLQPPKTWDEFFAQAPQIKAASYIPLALGANAQQDANIKALDRCAQQGRRPSRCNSAAGRFETRWRDRRRTS